MNLTTRLAHVRQVLRRVQAARGDVMLTVDDGDALSLDEFMSINELDDHEIEALRDLDIGDEYVFGGGAVAESVVKRVQ